MRYAAALLVVGLTGWAASADEPKLPLLVEEDFSQGARRWKPTDPKAWRLVETDRGMVFNQFAQSQYKPPHRSPFNFALLQDVLVGNFVLEAELQSTGPDVPHRDMVLVWGYQDPAHFYYVHLGKRTDDHANQIFIVNDAPRVKISTKTSPGTPWTNGWHRVRVARDVAKGSIEVYFDDMKTPMMTAGDRHFTWGQVGIGSFDDSGNWSRVKLWGERVKR